MTFTLNVFPVWSWSLQPKTLKQNLNPSLNWVFSLEIVLACYPSLSNNFWHKHSVKLELLDFLTSIGLHSYIGICMSNLLVIFNPRPSKYLKFWCRKRNNKHEGNLNVSWAGNYVNYWLRILSIKEGVNNKINTLEDDGLRTYIHFTLNMKTRIWNKLRALISHRTTTFVNEELCKDKGFSK